MFPRETKNTPRMDSMRRTAKRIDALVDLIPARYYLSDEEAGAKEFLHDATLKTTEVIARLGQKKLQVRKENEKRAKKLKKSAAKLGKGSKSVEEENSLLFGSVDAADRKRAQQGAAGSTRSSLQDKLKAKISQISTQRAEKNKQKMAEWKAKKEKEGKTQLVKLKEDIDYGVVETDKKKQEFGKVNSAEDRVGGRKTKRLEHEIRVAEREEKKARKELGDEEFERAKESDKLDDAFLKASGKKGKSVDVEKLKKVQKNHLKRKDKKREGWTDRLKGKNEKMAKRQENRQKLLDGKMRKNRRGFEGERGVINKDKDI